MSSGFSTETLTGAEPVRAERARILSELLDDLDELADTAVTTMRAEIPAYAAQDEAFHADVRDQVARALPQQAGRAARRPHGRRSTTSPSPAGRRCAGPGPGSPWPTTSTPSASASRSSGSRWSSGPATRPPGTRPRSSLAAPLMRYCDFASTHAANAYMEFQQYAAAEAVRESRDLLETLLAGDAPTRGRQLAAAQAHGLGARHAHAAARGDRGPARARGRRRAAATGPDRGADARHAACAAIARTGGNGTRTLSVVRQSEIVAIPALGPGGDPERAVRPAAGACARACSARASCWPWASARSSPDTARIPQAYQEARAVLEFLPEDGGVAALPRITAVPVPGAEGRRHRPPPGRSADHRAAGRGPGARRRAHRHDPRLRRRRPEPARLPPSGCRSTPTPPSTGCAASRSAPGAACAGSTTSSICSWRSRCSDALPRRHQSRAEKTGHRDQ